MLCRLMIFVTNRVWQRWQTFEFLGDSYKVSKNKYSVAGLNESIKSYTTEQGEAVDSSFPGQFLYESG